MQEAELPVLVAEGPELVDFLDGLRGSAFGQVDPVIDLEVLGLDVYPVRDGIEADVGPGGRPASGRPRRSDIPIPTTPHLTKGTGFSLLGRRYREAVVVQSCRSLRG